MKKSILSSCVLLILALALPALAAQPKAPADGLKMSRTKQPVTFNHSTHQKDMKCGACHHEVNGKEDYGKCGNAGCHDSLDRKDKSAKGYYHVLHTKAGTKFATCAACHAQVAEKFPEKKKDMTACKQSKCHP